MSVIAVVPSRFGSTRLHAKPLLRETGKYLVQHVCERVQAARLIDRVVVATDDERIATAVRSFGGEVAMTRADHPSGTSRVAEVADQLQAQRLIDGEALILNVQGDEPEVDPAALDALIQTMMHNSKHWKVGTLAAPFDSAAPRHGPGSPQDPNTVKVVLDHAGQALYFSRSLIPFPRNAGDAVDCPSRWLMHMGVYAFRADTLRQVTGPDLTRPQQEADRLDLRESLEQLAWLYAGLTIGVVTVSSASRGIDTPEDYAAFVSRVRKEG